ncbi:GNAT family N-acetyltransferase [Nocardioides coralli]|uniref:GNAT family N-acetyltransferase n=1 Tax=Nocardioides coralli TaxID=2872154 RepID=UPI001CA39E77|nr:GNAT family N-acetyltransferase [Nocardioides coralli]QZY28059.1 GNAT family N-acetyltransferase [Nocardioides coralli]
MSSPSADVSCRVAWSDDAPAIAALQLAARQHDLAGVVPDAALQVDPDVAAAAWQRTLTRPDDARVRVLVALERNRVVGFAITSPAGDPDTDQVADAELLEFTIDPRERGKGHGSRLLQAAVDTMAADRFTRSVTWLMASDDALRGFLESAGWAPDTAHRELDLDGTGTTTVKQVRLHTTIAESA